MAYKPTLFTPLEIVDRINMVLDPMEKSLQQLLNHPALQLNSRKQIAKNLNHFDEFRQKQRHLINNYSLSSHRLLKA